MLICSFGQQHTIGGSWQAIAQEQGRLHHCAHTCLDVSKTVHCHLQDKQHALTYVAPLPRANLECRPYTSGPFKVSESHLRTSSICSGTCCYSTSEAARRGRELGCRALISAPENYTPRTIGIHTKMSYKFLGMSINPSS